MTPTCLNTIKVINQLMMEKNNRIAEDFQKMHIICQEVESID